MRLSISEIYTIIYAMLIIKGLFSYAYNSEYDESSFREKEYWSDK